MRINRHTIEFAYKGFDFDFAFLWPWVRNRKEDVFLLLDEEMDKTFSSLKEIDAFIEQYNINRLIYISEMESLKNSIPIYRLYLKGFQKDALDEMDLRKEIIDYSDITSISC